jgi:hypothetical protein
MQIIIGALATWPLGVFIAGDDAADPCESS